jgi:integrase
MARHAALQGIETRHQKHCASHEDKRCNCQPSYRGVVYDPSRPGNRKGPRTKNLAEARGWRIDAQRRILRGGRWPSGGPTVKEAGERWLADAKAGVITTRGGLTYKPSTIRNYESSFNLHVVPVLGQIAVAKLRRGDVQVMVERLALTLAGSTVRNAVEPLQVICRHAVVRERLESNPCDGIELPARSGRRFVASGDGLRRETIATPAEADALIQALPAIADRAVWATAFYAGLRRGELRGLALNDVDLERHELHVGRAWDALDGAIDPKSHTATRLVPINAQLARILREHLAQHDGAEFMFPGYGRWRRTYGPFSADALLKRSRKAWRAASLQPIGLHEARHTYASLLIDAGVPIAKVSRRMGHSSISVTERVYFHLLRESHDHERALMDAYFADARSRQEEAEGAG